MNHNEQLYNFVNPTEFDLSSLQRFLENDPDMGEIPNYKEFQCASGFNVRAVFFNEQIPNCWTLVQSGEPTSPTTTLSHHHWALKSGEGQSAGEWMVESEILTDTTDSIFPQAVTEICQRKLQEFGRICSDLDLTEDQYLESDGEISKTFGQEDVSALRYWRDHPFKLRTLLGSDSEPNEAEVLVNGVNGVP